MDQNVSIDTLKDLYKLLGDGIKGYQEASSKAATPQLASFLSTLASDRMGMKQELGTAIGQLHPGVDKLDDGTLKGDLHRAWLDIRQALTSSEDPAVLAECERGEEYLTKRYDTVMEDSKTPPEVMILLRKQASQVTTTLSTITALRKTVEYATH